MPINISNNLPAYTTLINENIFVMTDEVAIHQDMRPLEIAILNLMPKKIETETQLLRLLSNTPLQVNIDLVQVASHVSKNTSIEHMLKFYNNFDEIKNKRYDGFIITGAPVEQMEFADVDYWEEICSIFEWTKSHVYSTLHICWGAQAGLYYHYGIPKYPLDKKMFGIFPHKIEKPNHPLLKGFDETFMVPHSRHTEIRREDIEKNPSLEILTSSEQAGIHIVADKTGRQFFITGHSEYDRDTIANEYFRDKDKGLDIDLPVNYFPENNPDKMPLYTWRCHANLMFSNWLNYCVYQPTPFNLDELKPL
ncbi:MAG TPA: homoserine O-succinyltransferase [Oscillospiraceae bacterium]|nr:homoserine O-succinyltransferase [Oscillospiraceae bacterium]